jgi:AbrB family looped-hinge helix DNA binding protein
MLAELRAKSQITLPKPILEKMGLIVGDLLEISERDGGIFMLPVVVTPKNQQKEMTKSEYDAFLNSFCGCIDDPTMVKPPDIEIESPREPVL